MKLIPAILLYLALPASAIADDLGNIPLNTVLSHSEYGMYEVTGAVTAVDDSPLTINFYSFAQTSGGGRGNPTHTFYNTVLSLSVTDSSGSPACTASRSFGPPPYYTPTWSCTIPNPVGTYSVAATGNAYVVPPAGGSPSHVAFRYEAVQYYEI